MIYKTITIPDLHGKDVWKQINPDEYDKIIFIGDYVDAPYPPGINTSKKEFRDAKILIDKVNGKTDIEILYNLNEVILFKEKYPDKVVLLVGNHDVPYIFYKRNPVQYRNVMCSGHRKNMLPELSTLYNDNFDKFQIMYQLGNVVWSHAGLTPEAYNSYFKLQINDRFDILVEEMNKLFILNDLKLYIVSPLRGGILYRYGSVVWADIREWKMGTYQFPFNQIVGHHPVDDMMKMYSENEFIQPPRFVAFTDVLNTQTKFFKHEVEI